MYINDINNLHSPLFYYSNKRAVNAIYRTVYIIIAIYVCRLNSIVRPLSDMWDSTHMSEREGGSYYGVSLHICMYIHISLRQSLISP